MGQGYPDMYIVETQEEKFTENRRENKFYVVKEDISGTVVDSVLVTKG